MVQSRSRKSSRAVVVENDSDEEDDFLLDVHDDEDVIPVRVLDAKGMARIHVEFSDGTEGFIHYDSLPDDLNGQYKKAVEQYKKTQREATKASLLSGVK